MRNRGVAGLFAIAALFVGIVLVEGAGAGLTPGAAVISVSSASSSTAKKSVTIDCSKAGGFVAGYGANLENPGRAVVVQETVLGGTEELTARAIEIKPYEQSWKLSLRAVCYQPPVNG